MNDIEPDDELERHPDDHEPQWEWDGESSYCIICGREPGPGE